MIQPPIQNTWYTMFHDFNVRLIWCTLIQINDETAQHQVEIRWTIDGNVYDLSFLANNNTVYYIYRDPTPSSGGTAGLLQTTSTQNAAFFVDKRGLDFLIEMRLTDVPGTNQAIYAGATYETS